MWAKYKAFNVTAGGKQTLGIKWLKRTSNFRCVQSTDNP
jgi:hypothetical protein